MRLAPCDACARHVRVDAERCPFCDVARTPRRELPPPGGSLSRAALYAAIVTTAACKKDAARAEPAVEADAAPAPLATASATASADVDAAPAVIIPSRDAATTLASPLPDAAPPPRPGKRAGSTCAATSECAAGLTCCVTGFCPRYRGRFDLDPNDPHQPPPPPPCTPPRTCVVGPCRPLPNPPYGCVFPDACAAALV